MAVAGSSGGALPLLQLRNEFKELFHKAEPLLLTQLSGCHASEHHHVQQQQQQQQQHHQQHQWDGLLARFRKLREGLTAVQAPAELRCQVYELSADACAAAGNMAELLKCLQQLVNNIHPALIRQQHQEQPTDTVKLPPRWAEVAAALLLYFVCVPAQPVAHELVKQLRAAALPAWHQQHQHQHQAGGCSSEHPPVHQLVCLLQQPIYQLAVAATTAALSCNWVRFLAVAQQWPNGVAGQSPAAAAGTAGAGTGPASHPGCCGAQPLPPLVHAMLQQHVGRLRLLAVRRMAVAYRMLPSAVLQRSLALTPPAASTDSSQHAAYEIIVRLLQAAAGAAGASSKGVAIALAQARDALCLPETLQFRSV